MFYFLSSFFDAFLRVWKNRLVNKSNKLLAASVNCALYLFSALVVKFVVCNNLTVALIVVAINSFIGCYLAMWFDEKFNKNNMNVKYQFLIMSGCYAIVYCSDFTYNTISEASEAGKKWINDNPPSEYGLRVGGNDGSIIDIEI